MRIGVAAASSAIVQVAAVLCGRRARRGVTDVVDGDDGERVGMGGCEVARVSGSGYASQLGIRLQWLRELSGAKVVTLAAATPPTRCRRCGCYADVGITPISRGPDYAGVGSGRIVREGLTHARSA